MVNGKNKILARVAQVSKSTVESIRRKFFDFEDYLFEKKYGLELRGRVPNKDLVTTNKELLLHATAYQAVWNRNLRELFKEAQKTGYDFENFVDIGSGKGKACFYAHTRQFFDQIVGVEFSEPLVSIANKNKSIFNRKIQAQNIVFINADAGDFKLQNTRNFVFLFNPFDGVILEKFIVNNISNFKDHNSVIAYANDTQRLLLTKMGFETIFRNQTCKISLYQLT